MRYHVYTPVGRHASVSRQNSARDWANKWDFVGSYDLYEEAASKASSLCRTSEVWTEPGFGLPAAFFGKAGSPDWSAMVADHDIHADAA